MAKLKFLFSHLAVHFSLIVVGLITAILVIMAFDGSTQVEAQTPTGTDAKNFYLLLVEYAYRLDSGGFDRRFRYGMTEASKQQFENFLNTVRYKENCTQYESMTVDSAMLCVVNGQDIDYIQYGSKN